MATTDLTQSNILRSPRTSSNVPNISLSLFLTLALEKYGDKPLMISPDKSLSYTANEILLSSRRFASALIRRGLKPGDVVCICTSNNVHFAAVMLGALSAGAVITLGKPADTSEELRFRLETTGATYLLIEMNNLQKARKASLHLPKLQEILTLEKTEDCPSFTEFVEEDDGSAFTGSPKVDPKETPLLLPFSSGTTGLPKAIVHTHSTFITSVINITHPSALNFSSEDVILGMYPFCHFGGFFILNVALVEGITMSVVPYYESDMFLEVIEKHKVSVVALAVSIIHRLIKDPKARQYNLTSMREIITGGAPLNQEANEEVIMTSFPFLQSIRQVYGLSETGFLTCVEAGRIIPNSVGKLISSVDLKVIHLDTGLALGPYESGEFYVRSSQIMKKYLHNPEATAQVFTQDGWFKTGDLGYYDYEGNLYITDRIKELIKTGFHQVSPTEIEYVLCSHPAIEDAAVVGIPDSVLGEVPYGFVVVKSCFHVTSETLLAFISARLAIQKQLKGLTILDEIPRSQFGKIERKWLKDYAIQQLIN
ncbi:uncharacterized protein LOC143229800 [Tachypleus tridentatus]|uniref:uncharacterized protein LOC143229800 n=1 Tax=Tachypleus tridentatus TaxID=6853 RepID=UPI003FD53D03